MIRGSVMRMAITMCHATRPKYTQQSLAAVIASRKTCDMRGVPILMHVEPHQQTAHVCRALAQAGDEVVVNPLRKGVNRNTVAAIDHGFEAGADFVVHVEDDVILAPDALAYFAWAAERFKNNWSTRKRETVHRDLLRDVDSHEAHRDFSRGCIATVAGYHRESLAPLMNRWREVRARSWLHVWGWGTWRDRWEVLREAINLDGGLTWDVSCNAKILSKNWLEVFPTLSRTQNIGLYSSVHPGTYSPEWYQEHHVLKHWAGDQSLDEMADVGASPWTYVGYEDQTGNPQYMAERGQTLRMCGYET